MTKLDYEKANRQQRVKRSGGTRVKSATRSKPHAAPARAQWLELRRLRKELGLPQGAKPRSAAECQHLIVNAHRALAKDQRVGERERAQRRRDRRMQSSTR